MSIHVLKIQTVWLDRVLAGEKTAEIRAHDRDFQVGDILHLTEVSANGSPVRIYDSEGGSSDPRSVDVTVTHVLPASLSEGLVAGVCLLSFHLDGVTS